MLFLQYKIKCSTLLRGILQFNIKTYLHYFLYRPVAAGYFRPSSSGRFWCTAAQEKTSPFKSENNIRRRTSFKRQRTKPQCTKLPPRVTSRIWNSISLLTQTKQEMHVTLLFFYSLKTYKQDHSQGPTTHSGDILLYSWAETISTLQLQYPLLLPHHHEDRHHPLSQSGCTRSSRRPR